MLCLDISPFDRTLRRGAQQGECVGATRVRGRGSCSLPREPHQSGSRGVGHPDPCDTSPSLCFALLQNLPSFHIKVRMATVSPRILPSTDYEVRDYRDLLERGLDMLLSSSGPRVIDNGTI